MTAVYPVAVRTYIEHDDYVEIVDASHVNALQDEMGAVESTLGLNPHVYAPTGAAPTAYRTVGARLDAHELAIVNQAATINQILDAEKQGWQAPALSVTGYVNPGVRLLAGNPGMLSTTTAAAIAWTGVAVDIGDMYVPNANVVILPKGGLWLVRATLTCAVDWATLDTTQNYYNRLGVNPITLAYQKLGFNMLINGVDEDYEFGIHHWAPASERPTTTPTFTIVLGKYGVFPSGSQVIHQAEQYYGHMTGAYATMTATFQQSVPGVS